MRHFLDGATGSMAMAIVFWSWAHFMAHFGIAAGYVIAVSQNNGTFLKLMRISTWTQVFGAGFFLFCGATHIGLALHVSDSPVITLTDELQLISIWGFLIFLMLDGRRAIVRLSNALWAIREEFDGLAVVRGETGQRMIARGEAETLEIGSRVVATIEFALFSADDQPPGEVTIPIRQASA